MAHNDGSEPITNDQDIIDSREIIERINYLTYIREEWETPEEEREGEPEEFTEELAEELRILQEVAEEGESSPDWKYGETLISDIYFEDYAKQLAEDITDYRESEAQWPYNHIDWYEAAQELQNDYTSIDFDGETYWIRS
jgi:hypothetical protein